MRSLLVNIKDIVGYQVLRVVMGISFVAITAQVQIPLQPVPITLTTVGVLFIALYYEKKEALQSIVGYIILGGLGIQVFSGFTGGVPILFGPTGGYLFGMILCAYIVTTLRNSFGEDSVLKLIIYSALGSIGLVVVGLIQLSLFVSADNVLVCGLYPFILPGVVKSVLTSILIRFFRKI